MDCRQCGDALSDDTLCFIDLGWAPMIPPRRLIERYPREVKDVNLDLWKAKGVLCTACTMVSVAGLRVPTCGS